jgi:hypothetical protein
MGISPSRPFSICARGAREVRLAQKLALEDRPTSRSISPITASEGTIDDHSAVSTIAIPCQIQQKKR